MGSWSIQERDQRWWQFDWAGHWWHA